jgi:hypothetical protein
MFSIYRCCFVLPLFGAALSSYCPRASGQDTPLLRKLLEQMIVAELASHDREEKAWYNEKTRHKKKIAQFNFFGREIDQQIASWTEQSQTWIWLEKPKDTLSFQLAEFTLKEGRVQFAVAVRAKAAFRVWGRIPRLAKGNASGTVWMKMNLVGSAAVGLGGLSDARITRLEGTMSDLQFTNDLASPLEDLVEDALNDHVKHKNKRLRASVEKAINRVHL